MRRFRREKELTCLKSGKIPNNNNDKKQVTSSSEQREAAQKENKGIFVGVCRLRFISYATVNKHLICFSIHADTVMVEWRKRVLKDGKTGATSWQKEALSKRRSQRRRRTNCDAELKAKLSRKSCFRNKHH